MRPECATRTKSGCVVLGLALGTLAKSGHDKVTIIASPQIAGFGAWLEQLIAESTGKQGQGLIPVDAEPLGAPDCYGRDSVFVYLRLDSEFDAGQDNAIAALEKAGQPVLRFSIAARMTLARNSSAGKSRQRLRAR